VKEEGGKGELKGKRKNDKFLDNKKSIKKSNKKLFIMAPTGGPTPPPIEHKKQTKCKMHPNVK